MVINKGILACFLVITVILSLAGLLCKLVFLKQSYHAMELENIQLGYQTKFIQCIDPLELHACSNIEYGTTVNGCDRPTLHTFELAV